MRRTIALALVVVVVGFGAGVASAGQCPLLIKQLTEAAGKMADKGKADEVKKLAAEAQALHDAKKHAESVAKCDEAAKVAGIMLKKKG